MRNFFDEIQPFTAFHEVANVDHYVDVPDDWFIIITDVRGSTQAIDEGRYKDVNVVGAASIIAAMNASDASFPYVFGGDGATLVVPPAAKDPVLRELTGVAKLSRETFKLDLRVGIVPVSEVSASGDKVRVAKHAVSDHMTLATFWGSGLMTAEDLIKGSDDYLYDSDNPPDPNIAGLQCRWKPFKSRRGVVASVLVAALNDSDDAQADTYRKILNKVDALSPDPKPVHLSNANISVDRKTLSTEVSLKMKPKNALGFGIRWSATALATLVGRAAIDNGIAFAGIAADYKEQVISNTDFRKFDEMLRMVIDISQDALTELETYLEDLHSAGEIAFGIHRSDSALMTCLVFDLNRNHLHFVDGNNGGYALAAKQLKAQLKA